MSGIIKRIAVIGNGPSSLATAKHNSQHAELIRFSYLLAENAFSDIVIVRQRTSVSGIWN